jgi:hypothetical protein
VDLDEYAWIHLEGRNRENVLQILAYLASQRISRLADGKPAFRVSVEVEKVNRNFEDFIPHADVVFISKVCKLPQILHARNCVLRILPRCF